MTFIDDTNAGQMDLGKISIEPNADPFEMVIEASKDYTFSVTNNSSQSTSFRISISLENPEKPRRKNKKTMLENLLIVEDNPSMRRLIKSVVKDLAVSVHECADGSAALDAYEKFHPEWVLMDIEMRQKDGFAATREIVAAHPEAKIVIVTKHTTERMREVAKKAGAYDYILKENLMEIRVIVH